MIDKLWAYVVVLGLAVMFFSVIMMMWHDFVFWAKVFSTAIVLLFGLFLAEKAVE